MTIALRILLFAFAVYDFLYMRKKIKKAQMKIIDGFLWILIAVLLILFSIFPQIVYAIADLFGIISPANLLFAVICGLLLLVVFSQSMRISRAEQRINELAEELALRDRRFCGMETEDDRILDDKENT